MRAIFYSYQRGRSSVGRAFEWHSKGQGFDPPRLHYIDILDKKLVLRGYLLIVPFLFLLSLVGLF